MRILFGLAMLAAVLGLWLLSRKGFGPLKRKLGAAALFLLLALLRIRRMDLSPLH